MAEGEIEAVGLTLADLEAAFAKDVEEHAGGVAPTFRLPGGRDGEQEGRRDREGTRPGAERTGAVAEPHPCAPGRGGVGAGSRAEDQALPRQAKADTAAAAFAEDEGAELGDERAAPRAQPEGEGLSRELDLGRSLGPFEGHGHAAVLALEGLRRGQGNLPAPEVGPRIRGEARPPARSQANAPVAGEGQLGGMAA